VGDELTPERVNAMRHVGVKKVRIFAGYTTIDLRDDENPTTTRERVDPVLAFAVADADGEVLAEAGADLTEALKRRSRPA
jgi:DNA-directed RNA polymerase subunit beta